MTWRHVCVLFATLVIVGCSASEPDGASVARVDTLAGGRIAVTNSGAPTWTADTAWRLLQDLRVGGSGSSVSEAEQFGDVVSIVSDSKERIYVLDGMSQEVRVFNPDGVFSHAVGRRGSGPGEFSGARTLTIGRGDTLRVLDDGQMRFSVFAPDGTFLYSHRRDIVGHGALRGAVLDDGSFVDWAIAFPAGQFGAQVEYHPIRYSPRFERADTLPPLELTQEMLPSGRAPQMYFSGGLTGAVDGSGNIWFAHSREYQIYRRSLNGDTTLVFSLPATAAPLEHTDHELVRLATGGSPRLAEFVEALPKTRPIVRGILPNNAGQVLVIADVSGEAAGAIVDIFRETGEYLGRMMLEPPISLDPRGRPPVAHATGDHLYIAVRDEVGIPYVIRLRIAKED